MELNKQFSLPAVLWAETAAAEDEKHGISSLQFGEFSPFRGVVGKFIIGEDSPRNDVRSHRKSSTVGCALPSKVSYPATSKMSSSSTGVPSGRLATGKKLARLVGESCSVSENSLE